MLPVHQKLIGSHAFLTSTREVIIDLISAYEHPVSGAPFFNDLTLSLLKIQAENMYGITLEDAGSYKRLVEEIKLREGL
jgi:hypothetical protein